MILTVERRVCCRRLDRIPEIAGHQPLQLDAAELGQVVLRNFRRKRGLGIRGASQLVKPFHVVIKVLAHEAQRLGTLTGPQAGATYFQPGHLDQQPETAIVALQCPQLARPRIRPRATLNRCVDEALPARAGHRDKEL
ncbi:hypothetical protein [Bosea sp. Root670]|uniref:hypothetical protein n=1 Tax=Bosea sp. Root670 TaxID=1736583 RepID=UPI0012E3D01B|nr:hypothetical protein [Bosea sp. Root670]